MSSHPRIETPGSSRQQRVGPDLPAPAPTNDLAASLSSTDDTPTIISRKPVTPPPVTFADPTAAIRGHRLAHFELIDAIGVGGMAAVLRARDTQLDRFVALKILPHEMAADPENVKRFHQEARSAAKLDHENIARVYFCGEDQRYHFIAFEFVEGDNLRALLDRRGKLPAGEAVHYVLQIAAGLAHASQRGVVHRDIKPSNIIITPNGRAKLVDMGLARSLERRADNDLTQSGVTLGTFDYISPEQAIEPREADVRSDIYSLGCTFYHVLTGHAPVPEGTAAKKLHHHQHVKPVDPREFVPDLPVEVVQILDRMMAKNPRERIQSAEQLVHQLLLAAKQLGTTPEVPEGVLTVEAALPAAPSARPLLWTSLAAAMVIGLVLLLDLAPSGTPVSLPAPEARHELADGSKDATGKAAAKSHEDGLPTRAAPADQVEARYLAPRDLSPTQLAQDLVRWLEQHASAERLEIVLGSDLDLSQLQSDSQARGLLIQAKHKITLRTRERGDKVTIHFRYDSAVPSQALVALTLRAAETTMEGIRFVVDAAQSDVALTALRLQGANHVLDRCEFVQAQPSPRLDARFTSVHADAASGSLGRKAVVKLTGCAFLGFAKHARTGDASDAVSRFEGAAQGGQVALRRDGAAQIEAENCVFGPHTQMVRLEGMPANDFGQVTLRHCSLLLAARRSAVFEAVPGATAPVHVQSTLIARLAGEAEEGAVLIRQAEERAIVYQGTDNAYYDLDGYWATRDDWQQASWGAFRRLRLSEGSKDEASRVVPSVPWRYEMGELLQLLERGELAKAFEVNLRLAALRRQGAGGGVVGANSILGATWLPESLPILDEKADPVGPRILVVEQGYDDSSNGVFATVESAVLRALPADVIVLRHNGELKLEPVSLSNAKLKDLTIRAARKFRPLVTLGSTTEPEASLFRVHEGTLRLEGLEFRLAAPDRSEFKVQTVVSLVGDCVCVLKDCIVTLRRGGETALAVAMLPEAGKVMKMDVSPARSREQGPKLELKNCFVRGEGDLLWCRANRPCLLKMEETLAALSGSLVNLDVNPEAATVPDGQQLVVRLTRTTTYLGEHLLSVNVGKDPRGLVGIRCEPTECLFLPATANKTLVHLEGPESEERSLRDKFTWVGGQNGYGAYTSLLTQETGEGMATAPMGMEKWKMLPGEEMSTFGVKMDRLPKATERFGQMEPGQFKAAEGGMRELGATLSKTPRPRVRSVRED